MSYGLLNLQDTWNELSRQGETSTWRLVMLRVIGSPPGLQPSKLSISSARNELEEHRLACACAGKQAGSLRSSSA